MDADLFTEGAIYWYENKTNTKEDYEDENLNHDFLVSRPVYILRTKKVPFDLFTVNVVAITSSSRRVGIPINITGIRDGKILPYNVRSVHTQYLTRYMGHASKEIMDEVYQAVQYHMAYTDIKPKYLEKYESVLQRKERLVTELNQRESTVYEFVNKKCVFKSNYFTDTTELFQLYKKWYPDGYKRLQDFNNAFTKIIEVFPETSIRIEYKKKIISGMSINGNIHKNTPVEVIEEQASHKKKVYDEITLNLQGMTRDQIIDTLDDVSKKAYYSLDIIEKIDNYCRDVSKLRLPKVSAKDIPAVHMLIKQDIDEKKKKVFRLMDQHLNPLSFSTVNQYLVFICSNDEILKHIDEKYLRKGGLPKIRKTLKNNVQHYFVKCK